MWEIQGPTITKAIGEKENKVGALTLLDCKTCCKVAVMKTVWCKNEQDIQINRIDLRVRKEALTFMIKWFLTRQFNGEKMVLNKGCWVNTQKNDVALLPHTMQDKITLKWIIELNGKVKKCIYIYVYIYIYTQEKWKHTST